MPNYEYRCRDCQRKFEIFMTFAEYGQKTVECRHCHSQRVDRLLSRVRFARSDESRLENLADPSNLDGLDEDPRSLGRMMRKMKDEVGEEMPPEFDEVVGRLEKGQSPDDIEKDLPELGQMDASGGGMDDFGGMLD